MSATSYQCEPAYRPRSLREVKPGCEIQHERHPDGPARRLEHRAEIAVESWIDDGPCVRNQKGQREQEERDL